MFTPLGSLIASCCERRERSCRSDAIFASESNYEEKLKNIKDIDGVVLISASGEKHAPVIAKVSKKYGKSMCAKFIKRQS